MDRTLQFLTRWAAPTTRRRAVRAAATALTVALALGAAACGGDDDQTIPLSEWLDEFDQMCVELQTEAAPELTEQQFITLSDRYLDRMRAITPPAEMADTAAELLDLIEESTSGSELDDAQVAALDERALTALTELGVTGACITGVAG